MTRPPHETAANQESADEQLIQLAIKGHSSALQSLLGRHRTWIYNLALYMLHHREDALDATQEVLVKVATNLATFKGNSSFRTWVRTIAVHHVLDMRRSRPEHVVTGFECYSDYLEKAPDTDVFTERGNSPEAQLLVAEARTSCVMGMLLCLDRQQRIVFLLGEVLETSDTIAAELLGISKDNFRQRLSRAREQLSQFMSGRCGLVNPANPCRCARKTSAFIRDGIVDPKQIRFATGHLNATSLRAADRCQSLQKLVGQAQQELRQLYPLFEAPDATQRLAALLDGSELKATLNLH